MPELRWLAPCLPSARDAQLHPPVSKAERCTCADDLAFLRLEVTRLEGMLQDRDTTLRTALDTMKQRELEVRDASRRWADEFRYSVQVDSEHTIARAQLATHEAVAARELQATEADGRRDATYTAFAARWGLLQDLHWDSVALLQRAARRDEHTAVLHVIDLRHAINAAERKLAATTAERDSFLHRYESAMRDQQLELTRAHAAGRRAQAAADRDRYQLLGAETEARGQLQQLCADTIVGMVGTALRELADLPRGALLGSARTPDAVPALHVEHSLSRNHSLGSPGAHPLTQSTSATAMELADRLRLPLSLPPPLGSMTPAGRSLSPHAGTPARFTELEHEFAELQHQVAGLQDRHRRDLHAMNALAETSAALLSSVTADLHASAVDVAYTQSARRLEAQQRSAQAAGEMLDVAHAAFAATFSVASLELELMREREVTQPYLVHVTSSNMTALSREMHDRDAAFSAACGMLEAEQGHRRAAFEADEERDRRRIESSSATERRLRAAAYDQEALLRGAIECVAWCSLTGSTLAWAGAAATLHSREWSTHEKDAAKNRRDVAALAASLAAERTAREHAEATADRLQRDLGDARDMVLLMRDQKDELSLQLMDARQQQQQQKQQQQPDFMRALQRDVVPQNHVTDDDEMDL
jgi:hypothetical protein